MKMKKRIVVLLMALVLAVGLIGCKDTLKSIVHKASGTSDEVQEEDTTRWADQTSDPLIIQGIADSSAKFATATADGCLYAVFNGIWSRQTSYFTVPSGTLSILALPLILLNSSLAFPERTLKFRCLLARFRELRLETSEMFTIFDRLVHPTRFDECVIIDLVDSRFSRGVRGASSRAGS